jgi:preprotein translocase subunit Sec61beta
MPYDSEAIIAIGFLVGVLVITAGLFAFVMTRKNKT